MFKKFKNWIIGLFLGSVVLAGGLALPNQAPDITKEKMQVAYEQSNIKAKYKMENASFVMEAKNENAIKIEVGDKTKQEFTPEMKIAKWDNEVSMRVKPKLNTKSKKKELIIDGEKIKYKQDKKEFHFYDVKKGDEILGGATSTIDAYEVEVILLEKPTSNIIEMEIETQGLDFFYQPELTQQEKDDGAFRPENVIGSYAVYHSEKQGDYSKMGLKNYRAGKAFHIYRPKIIDSAGKEIWGKLNITDNLLTVEIPQEFLDNAVYPVRHAAGLTFGYESKGASGDGSKEFFSGKYQSSDNGTISSITAYINNISSTMQGNFGYYSDNAGNPGNHIAHGTAVSISSNQNNWKTINVSGSITSSSYYWLTVQGENSGLACYHDTGGLSLNKTSHTFNDWSNNPGSYNYTHKLSIYATYTAGGEEEARRIIFPQ